MRACTHSNGCRRTFSLCWTPLTTPHASLRWHCSCQTNMHLASKGPSKHKALIMKSSPIVVLPPTFSKGSRRHWHWHCTCGSMWQHVTACESAATVDLRLWSRPALLRPSESETIPRAGISEAMVNHDSSQLEVKAGVWHLLTLGTSTHPTSYQDRTTRLVPATMARACRYWRSVNLACPKRRDPILNTNRKAQRGSSFAGHVKVNWSPGT